MSWQVCAEDGCPSLSESTRCPRHTKAKRRREDKRRPSARARGYDSRWERTAKAHRRAFPICQWPEGCLRRSEQTHHLDGNGPKGPRGHDWSNLQSLCAPHHAQVTATEQPGGWNA